MGYTSGCTSKVLEVNADNLFEVNGQVMSKAYWPEKVEDWRSIIDSAAKRHDVPPAMVAGVMAGESRGEPNVVSLVGACGLMQLMPEYFGGNADGRLFDPGLNVDLGTAYLRELLERYDGNPLKVLAGYNAGSARCSSADPDWGLVQNAGYVNKCLAYANEAAARGFSPRFPSQEPASTSQRIGTTLLVLGGVAAVAASLWYAEQLQTAEEAKA